MYIVNAMQIASYFQHLLCTAIEYILDFNAFDGTVNYFPSREGVGQIVL